MKVQARTNGNIVELPDETAQHLVSAGIYDAVTEEDSVTGAEPHTPPPASAPRKKAPR